MSLSKQSQDYLFSSLVVWQTNLSFLWPHIMGSSQQLKSDSYTFHISEHGFFVWYENIKGNIFLFVGIVKYISKSCLLQRCWKANKVLIQSSESDDSRGLIELFEYSRENDPQTINSVENNQLHLKRLFYQLHSMSEEYLFLRLKLHFQDIFHHGIGYEWLSESWSQRKLSLHRDEKRGNKAKANSRVSFIFCLSSANS